MNYPRKNPISLTQVHISLSNQIKFEYLKSSLPSQKTDRSFINNVNSKETKNQIKAHLSYLADSYFHDCKLSPRILRQHHILRNLRKNKDMVITKPDKGNGVVILDQKFYDNAVPEIISDIPKFEKLNEDPTLNVKLHYNVFYVS